MGKMKLTEEDWNETRKEYSEKYGTELPSFEELNIDSPKA